MKVAEKEEFYRHELGYGTQTRTVALPEEVDSENVHTELRNGILSVTLSKVRAVSKAHGKSRLTTNVCTIAGTATAAPAFNWIVV